MNVLSCLGTSLRTSGGIKLLPTAAFYDKTKPNIQTISIKQWQISTIRRIKQYLNETANKKLSYPTHRGL